MTEEVSIEEIKEDIYKVIASHFPEYAEIWRMHAKDMTEDDMEKIILKYYEVLTR